nr:transposase [Yersinia pseudotuberculosis]
MCERFYKTMKTECYGGSQFSRY